MENSLVSYALPDCESVIKQLANSGNPYAAWKLANRLFHSVRSKDLRRAYAGYQLAAQMGHYLGYRGLIQFKSLRNWKIGKSILRVAADRSNCPQLQLEYAKYLLASSSAKKKSHQIKAYLKRSARNGNPEAEMLLALIEVYGLRFINSPGELGINLERSFLQGDSKAGFALALLHILGLNGVPVDASYGFTLLEQLASDGFLEASVALGRYKIVSEDEEDKVFGLRHLICASERGSAEANFWLGYCHLFGLGCEKNLKVSVRYLREAYDFNISKSGVYLAKAIYEHSPDNPDWCLIGRLIDYSERRGCFECDDVRADLFLFTGDEASLSCPQLYDLAIRKAASGCLRSMQMLHLFHRDLIKSATFEDENFLNSYFWAHMAAEEMNPAACLDASDL